MAANTRAPADEVCALLEDVADRMAVAASDCYSGEAVGSVRFARGCVGLRRIRPAQVAIDAGDGGRGVLAMDEVVDLGAVAIGAQGVRAGRGAGLLRVHFVAVDALNAGLAMPAYLPLRQGALMAGAAHGRGAGNLHALGRVLRAIGAVARLAGDARQHKAAGIRVVPGGVAGKALAWLTLGLQINLEDRVKGGIGMRRVDPVVIFCGMTFAATLWAGIGDGFGGHRARLGRRGR